MLAQREGDVVEDVHRAEQGAVLEQQAELLAHLEELVIGHARDRLAVHEDVAGVRIEQADDVLDQHALAGSRRAEHHRDLIVGKAEVEAVENARAAELLDDVDDLDRVLAAVVALLARVPLVGVRLRRVDAGDRVVLVQVPELGSRLDVVVVALIDRAGEALVLGLQLGVLRLLLGDVLGHAGLLVSSLLVAHRPLLISQAPQRRRALGFAPFTPASHQPPIGARGLAPQKTSVPIIPMM